MAENKNQEEENNNKGGIVKIALMGVGGLVLLALGTFVGAYFFGGENTDPSSEISQIIEKKENPEKLEEDDESKEEIAENECAVHRLSFAESWQQWV